MYQNYINWPKNSGRIFEQSNDGYHQNTQNTAEDHEVSFWLSVPQMPDEDAAFRVDKINTQEKREHQSLRGGKMARVIYSSPNKQTNNATVTQY